MGRSTVIGKSSRFETGKRKCVFRGWPWGPGWACRLANFKFQISNFEFQRRRESKSGLEPSPVYPLRISNLKSPISNSELPASRFKFPISNFELPVSRSNTRGFTLLELMVVLTLLLILATMSMPLFQLAIVHAREAVMKDDLYTLRKLIDEFTLDKQRPPTSLDELVDAGYLRSGLPVDPFTGSNQTWRTDVEDVPLNPSQAASGIVDVHSGSDEIGLDGTPYSGW